MKEITIPEVERTNIALLVLGSIITIILMRDYNAVFSFAVASAIVTVNFRLLRKIIENLILKQSISKKDLLIRLPLKFLILLGAITVVVIYGDINLIFFLIGLSTVFLSILISQFFIGTVMQRKRSQENGS